MTITSNSLQGLQDLARSLVTRFDADRDGKLAANEFSSFLTSFINAAADGIPASGPIGAATTSSARIGGGRLEGFDAGKLQTSESPKYKFGRVASRYDVSAVHDKAGAEALLTSMAEDLRTAGFRLLEVRGDRLKFTDDAGKDTWVDVIRGSTSGSPAFQWLVA
jgi:hypothetical protein